jgi:APA family basic amino acid/polyamine antiporter
MSTEGEVAAKEAHELHRALGPWQLIALGIGAIIGAGIFVITGHAAATYAGPGVVISFMIAGLGCFFAGLCYAEFACMIPVAGSAYTYTYATMGRFLAWFIGWNLVLEYLAAASTVAVGWAGYFVQLLSQLGIVIPRALSSAPLAMTSLTDISYTGSVLNLPAMLVVGLATTMLVIGIKASAQFNAVMVVIKLVIVLLVIGFGLPLIVGENLDPFIPPNTGTWGEFGWSGVFRATGVIFFAYIGFDAVSVAAQEARNPQRDHAGRHPGIAADLHHPLHPDVADDDGPGAVHVAQRGVSGVRRDQQCRLAACLAWLPRQYRRRGGARLGRARSVARPIARLLRHVA